MNPQVSPEFGQKGQHRGNSAGDELLEPDSESDAAYMDNPYEMGGNSENQYMQSNNSFQNVGSIPSNRSSQSHQRVNGMEQQHRFNQQNENQTAENRRKSSQQVYEQIDETQEYIQPAQISIENIQKMSKSLNDFFKKQNIQQNSNNNFFNIQEDGQPVGQNIQNQEVDQNGQYTPSVSNKTPSQKNDEFDQSGKGFSSQTKFYQMKKMRPGEKPYQEQVLEIQGEVTQQERLQNYVAEQDRDQEQDYPKQIPSEDYNDDQNHKNFQQGQIPSSDRNNLYDESVPRQLNSFPVKEPQSFTQNKTNLDLVPMNMKDMAALSQTKQQKIKGNQLYNDGQGVSNNRFQTDDDIGVYQQNRFGETKENYTPNKYAIIEIDQNYGRNPYTQQRQMQRTQQYNNYPVGLRQETQSFNCSPQQKNSQVIDKYTSNKESSERKMKEAERFLQADNNIDKVNLKQILYEGQNASRISNKGDILSSTSRGIILDIEIETVSEKTRAKLLTWLSNIKLLKPIPNLDQKLHKICKDGVIFADIINLMEGKNQIIKGLERKPKKEAQIVANYIKIFNYLRNFDKVNPRYLSQQSLIQQNQNIFWGFLDDLWYFYNNKISPNDIRYNPNSSGVIQPAQHFNQSQYSTLNTSNQNKSMVNQIGKAQNNITNTNNQNNSVSQFPQNQQNLSKNQNNINQEQTESQYPQQQDIINDSTQNHIRRNKFENYEDIMHGNHDETKRKKSKQHSKDINNMNQNIMNDYDQNIYTTEEQIQHSQYPHDFKSSFGNQNQDIQMSNSQIIDLAKKWLINLGFTHMLNKSQRLQENYIQLVYQDQEENDKNIQKRNFIKKKNPNGNQWGIFRDEEEKVIVQDPIKNGVLMCLALSRIEMCRVDQMYRQPQNMEQCNKNYDLAFRNIRARSVYIPIDLLWKQKEIFKGELDSFWQICYGLMISTNNDYVSNQIGGQTNNLYPDSNKNTHQVSSPSFSQNISPKNMKPIQNNYATNEQRYAQKSQFMNSNSGFLPNNFTNHLQYHVNPQQVVQANKMNSTGSIILNLQNQQQNVDMLLPYSEESLFKLKVNIMQWIEYMGIFSEMNVECQDFASFLNLCREGAILCLICCHAFNINIVGINRKSCTKQTSLSNIRKFLDVFKRTKGLPNIFFVTEEAIYDMKEHLLLYLLEEIMRFQDNIPCRQPFSLQGEPYIKSFQHKNFFYPIKSNLDQLDSIISDETHNQQNPNYTKGQRDQPIEKPSIHNKSNLELLKTYNENFLNQSNNQSEQNINYNGKYEQDGIKNSKSNTSLAVNYSKSPTNQQQMFGAQQQKDQSPINQQSLSFMGNKSPNLQNGNAKEPQSNRNDSAILKTLNSPINKQDQSRMNNSQLVTQQQMASAIKTDGCFSEYNTHVNDENDKDAFGIKSWLSIIGFEELANNLNFQDETLLIFKDGIVLWKILERLEGKPMKGINYTPKVNAHFKYNLKKCIELLEKKLEMNQELLWDEDQLYSCSSEYMKQLLTSISHAYRKTTKSLKRTQGSSVFSQQIQR